MFKKPSNIITYIFCFSFLFLCLFYKDVFSEVKGSETQLSIEPFYTFPAADNDNTMLGFGWFKNGFALEDASTSCTFDSVYPVSGDIHLNGGTLHLLSDFIMQNTAACHTPGTIIANDFLVDVATSISCIGSFDGALTYENVHINVNDDFTITGSILFSGDSLVDGNGHRIIFGDSGCLLVDSGATLTLRHMHLWDVCDGKIVCLGEDSRICLDDLLWMQSGDYSFTKGSLCIHSEVDFIGSYTFSYESCNTSTINVYSDWHVSGGLKFHLIRNGDVEPIAFCDKTSCLHLDNCNLSCSTNSICFTKGTVLCHHEMFLDITSTDSTDGLILGDGNIENDLSLALETGSAIHFRQGDLVYNNGSPDRISSRGSGAEFIRYSGTSFHMNEDLFLTDMVIADRNYDAAMLVSDGKNVEYANTMFEWPGVGIEMTGHRYNYYTNMLAGDDELFLIKGTLAAYTLVQGSGNVIYGGGSLAGPVILSDSDAEVQFRLSGRLINDITLNGGTVRLLEDLSFSKGYKLCGSGKVDLGANKLTLGPAEQTWDGDLYWDSDGGHIDFSSNIQLSGTWTFSGDCYLHGLGNSLIFMEGGEIVVEEGSSLTIKEMCIKNLSGNRIRCLDGASYIKFYDDKAVLDGDYTFTQGRFDVWELFHVRGGHKFIYQSTEQSLVFFYSNFVFDENTTFSFDPIWSGQTVAEWESVKRAIDFYDDTSVLQFDGGTLHVTGTGMRLFKGTVNVSGNASFISEATTTANGLWFGDGVSAANNIDLNVLADAYLRWSGPVVDKTVG